MSTAKNNEIRYDVAGYEHVTAALRELLNQYPALPDGDEITFAMLADDGGKAMFPMSGGVIERERTSVTGKVHQICRYPFYVIYRAGGLSENRKAAVKVWLDQLGEWLERRTISIDDTAYKLDAYPVLTDSRNILSIERQTPAYLDSITEDQVESWAIVLNARYENTYYKEA